MKTEINVKKILFILFSSLTSSYTLFEKIIKPEYSVPFVISMAFAALFLINRNICLKGYKNQKYIKASCILFAVSMVIGDSFKQYGSLHLILGNPFINNNSLELLFENAAGSFGFLKGIFGNILMFLSAVVKCIGYYYLFNICFIYLKKLIKKIIDKQYKSERYEKLTNSIFGNKTFIKIFAIIFILWLPYWIIKFPGTVSSDAYSQILQATGKMDLNSHHPIFVTFIVGIFFKLGSFIGGTRLGIILCVLAQYSLMDAVFSYCICKINEFKINKVYCWCLLGFYSLFPTFPLIATYVLKDAYYCSMACLLILETIIFIRNYKNNETSIKNIILLSVSMTFLSLTRNNGIYLVIPVFIIASVLLLKIKKSRIKGIAVLLLPFIIFELFNILQYDVLKIKKGSIAEALSIPFQQTARYVKEHPNDVTDDEKKIIDDVLIYDTLAKRYNPLISDNVKNVYTQKDELLSEYFSVWKSQFSKHPVTYFEATMNLSYPAFYPDVANSRAYSPISTIESEDYNQLGGIFSVLRLLLLAFIMIMSVIPIFNPVYYIWLLLTLIIRNIQKKKFADFLIYAPLIVQILVIIAGPAVINQPRYLFPIYWTILLPVALILEERAKN